MLSKAAVRGLGELEVKVESVLVCVGEGRLVSGLLGGAGRWE